MTSHNDQIRALIAEIDDLLGSSPGLLWGLSGDRARHRAALEHLRSYLSDLQNKARQARIHNLPPAVGSSIEVQLASMDPTEMDPADSIAGEFAPGELAGGHLLEQLSRELSQLRHSLLAPLQAELEQLQAQRQILSQEVQLLQQQRQRVNAASTAGQEQLLRDFMETLMVRLQERLVVQVADVLQQNVAPLLATTSTAALPAAEQPQIEQLHDRANALLSNLDSTLQVFSKTLEQNVQGYQQSLTQGLERMHSLGHQGEVMISSLVDRLAEQMEARTALYLQSSGSPRTSLSGSTAPLWLPGQADLEMGLGGAIAPDQAAQASQAALSGFGSAASNAAAPTQQSTSSAGIARRRVMAAQASDRAEMAISDRDLGIPGLNWSNTGLSSGFSSGLASQSASLEDFYASLETSPGGATWPVPLESEPQGQTGPSSGRSPGTLQGASARLAMASAAQGAPAGGRYQKLEDALFDGIPEGGFPQALHPSQAELLQDSLPDLADRRFDDFATFAPSRREALGRAGEGSERNRESMVALYGDPSYWRNAAPAVPPAKKNAFLRRIMPARTA